jgi:hypothetical protein
MSTTAHQKRYLRASAVRRRYGDISEMTLHRWLHCPELNFPQPEYHGRNRFWDEAALEAYDREWAIRSAGMRARRRNNEPVAEAV